jgi:hypothetical protein
LRFDVTEAANLRNSIVKVLIAGFYSAIMATVYFW